MKYLILILSSFLFITGVRAQEVLSGLTYNPVIKQELKKMESQGYDQRFRDEIPPIYLPFFDDFHQQEIFPDAGRWSTSDTYVNADFPLRSVNVGAATFDAIDAKGNLYPQASTFPFLADQLISNLIRLDSVFDPVPRPLTVADSVYFSFYYQPQGRGNAPERWDSLVLQFGVYSGDSVFGYYDSIQVPASIYIGPDEFILPFDTVFAPPGCDSGLYIIATDTISYEDEFMMPCDSVIIPVTEWFTVWSTEGMKLDSFYNKYNTYSRQVLVPITDSLRYFRKDFQVRFFNYASLSSDFVPSWRSNTDQWNVDYIYLNKGRSRSDTNFRKITFAEKAPSMLKRYESMPYSQYKNNPTNEMADSALLFITNLDDEAYNTDYYYRVREIDGTYDHLYDGGGCNLPPFYEFGYQKCDQTCGAAHACPPVNYIYPLGFGEDSSLFRVEHRITGITAADTIGDTLHYEQKFYNYYAYDDGTPENGYGINTVFGRVAYRFRLNVSDTLRAVRMFFNRTQSNANDQFFTLVVWRDNNGEPGEIIYSEDNKRPKFTNDLYRLSTYYLDQPVAVSGVFYIGWLQTTTDNLNIGWDSYKDASANIFYNVTGQWEKTAFTGSMMMRPVLGKEFDPSGMDEHTPLTNHIAVYPNPNSSGILNIRIEGPGFPVTALTGELSIYNIYGQLVKATPFTRQVNIHELASGIYIIRYQDPANNLYLSGKFMVSR